MTWEPEEKETTAQRDLRLATNDLVFKYCQARLKADEADRQAENARVNAALARAAAEEAWRACKHAPAGVYSFKELGRLAVVVDHNVDYPKLTVIR